MKNLIRNAALAATLPLLFAFAPVPDNCGGCEDISTPLASNGPLLGDPVQSGGGHEYAINLVSAVTRNDGICAMQALSPPWSHVSVCREALPCTPRVTITVEVELANQLMYASVEVKDGQVCTATVDHSSSTSAWETLLIAPIFDQRVRNHCGTLDCPVEIDAEIEIVEFEFGVATSVFEDERTLQITGSLGCTSCSIVPIPTQTGVGD